MAMDSLSKEIFINFGCEVKEEWNVGRGGKKGIKVRRGCIVHEFSPVVCSLSTLGWVSFSQKGVNELVVFLYFH